MRIVLALRYGIVLGGDGSGSSTRKKSIVVYVNLAA